MKAVAAYKTDGGTGWAATDKFGRTWPVESDEAAEIEKARAERNAAAGKPSS